MNFEEIRQRLAAKFGERIGPLAPANKDAFVLVQAADVPEICRFLKEDPELSFDCLMNLSTVDWPKKNQIELVYHL
ncbi:MAG TPA: NADH-quinone oxidoreductase subunit C, partial [Myxococcales bacterium]